jgi:hypothetical protein
MHFCDERDRAPGAPAQADRPDAGADTGRHEKVATSLDDPAAEHERQRDEQTEQSAAHPAARADAMVTVSIDVVLQGRTDCWTAAVAAASGGSPCRHAEANGLSRQ